MTSHREQRPTGWRALVERARERESGDPRGVWARAADHVAASAWPAGADADAAPSRGTEAAPGDASEPAATPAHPHRATR